MRKFKVEDLLEFFVVAALEKWAGFRDGTEVMASVGLSPVNYSTVSKKVADVPYEIFKDLFHLLVSKRKRAKRRTKVIKQALLLVDSTTITVGKNRFPWAPDHREKSGIKLHVAFSAETGMPLEVKETGGLDHDDPAGENPLRIKPLSSSRTAHMGNTRGLINSKNNISILSFAYVITPNCTSRAPFDKWNRPIPMYLVM